MFALQIIFNDSKSKPELLYLGSPDAEISGNSSADIVIEDLKQTHEGIFISRHLGNSFYLRHKVANGQLKYEELCHESGEIKLNFGVIKVYPLDYDLRPPQQTQIDKAGLTVLKQVVSEKRSDFPAIVIRGKEETVVSVSGMKSIFLGRGVNADLRFKSAEVSGKHARIGFDPSYIWIEDLGSTNGTFVGGRQISGRSNINYGEQAILGRDVFITVVRSADELAKAFSEPKKADKISVGLRYPVVCCFSAIARPNRVELAPGSSYSVGRDPTCDLWLGAPHVSRKHFEIICDPDGAIRLVDRSSNGTAYSGGLLKNGESASLKAGEPQIFNLGNELTVAVCFSEEEEKLYRQMKGSAFAFMGNFEAPTEAENIMRKTAKPTLVENKPRIEEERRGGFGSVNDTFAGIARASGGKQVFILAAIFILMVIVVAVVAGIVISFFR